MFQEVGFVWSTLAAPLRAETDAVSPVDAADCSRDSRAGCTVVSNPLLTSPKANSHNFMANAHTKAAQDALVGIPHHVRMIVVEFQTVDLSCQPVGFHIVLICVIIQLALEVFAAAAFKASIAFIFGVGWSISATISLKLSFSPQDSTCPFWDGTALSVFKGFSSMSSLTLHTACDTGSLPGQISIDNVHRFHSSAMASTAMDILSLPQSPPAKTTSMLVI